MTNSGLGGIVGRLGLGNVDYGTRHAADQDNASRHVALNEMAGNPRRKQIRSIDIDAP